MPLLRITVPAGVAAALLPEAAMLTARDWRVVTEGEAAATERLGVDAPVTGGVPVEADGEEPQPTRSVERKSTEAS